MVRLLLEARVAAAVSTAEGGIAAAGAATKEAADDDAAGGGNAAGAENGGATAVAAERSPRRCCIQCGARKAPGSAALKKCSACMHARYCGEACQHAHWREHKSACKQHARAKGGAE